MRPLALMIIVALTLASCDALGGLGEPTPGEFVVHLRGDDAANFSGRAEAHVDSAFVEGAWTRRYIINVGSLEGAASVAMYGAPVPGRTISPGTSDLVFHASVCGAERCYNGDEGTLILTRVVLTRPTEGEIVGEFDVRMTWGDTWLGLGGRRARGRGRFHALLGP